MGAKNVEDIYVLTPAQQGMLVHCLEGGEEGVYFEQLTFTVEGPLDTGAFERAWQTVVDRHPILRSAFVWESLEKPLQGVARRATLPITRLDWREHDGARQDELFQAHLIAERRSGFNLTRPPLMRLSLIQVDEQRHRVVWHYHHLLLDGWSSSIVFNELFVCYRAYGRGEAPALPPARPFRDYIGWLQRQDPRQSEAFWREQLHDFHTATPLVVEQRVEGAAGLGFHELRLTLAAAEGAALHAFARRHQLTLNTLAQAAWALLLSRYSGAPDVVFGVTVSGRPAELPGVEQMVGMFINTLPLRVAVQPEAELLPWLKALQSHQSSLRQHEHSALVQVRKHSAVTPGTPLFESIVVFENYPPEAFASDDSASGLRISEVEPIERTNYPLTFVVMPGEALALYLSYDSRRFAEASVSLMLGHLRELLLSMAAGPLRLCDLSLLSAAEQRQLAAWNATARAYPRQPSLYDLFAAQVARTPAAPAVCFAGQTLSYAELYARANQLGHLLRRHGVRPDQLVGVCMERSIELVVALYGVLAAGGAYVPIDPSYPAARVAFMLGDAQLRVLLTQRRIAEGLPAHSAMALCLDDDAALLSDQPTTQPPAGAQPAHLAYVIYTSGSTGQPKGAMNSHAAIINRLLWMQEAYPLDASDRVLQKTPFSFDVSVWEFFWPLQVGAALVVAPPGAHQDSAALAALVAAERISTIHFVPSMLQAFVEEPGLAACRSLRRVICSGEALPYALQQRFFARSAAELHNLYGPTEAAVDVSAWACQRASRSPVVPIGRPIANLQLYVLDRQHRPAPVGVPGELWIGGVGLARGYWRRPDLTADRFMPDPYGAAGGRLYRTGDLARWRDDGALEYLGRLDFQVKIRGLRIELGEIEAALNRHPAVRESVVVAREDRPGQTRLVAYLVAQAGGDVPAASELRRHLQGIVPEYMLPAAFVGLEALPLSPNGKLERQALPAPASVGGLASAYRPPQAAVEQQLAAIWQQVLGVARVGADDNFFALGGDSIISLQVISRAAKGGLRITTRQLFQHQTIAGLAAALEAAPAATVEQGVVTGAVPLTPIQCWLFAQGSAEPQHFNQSLLLSVPATFDRERLARALSGLLAHHDALRARFVRDAAGAWRQQIGPPGELPVVTLIDLTACDDAALPAAIERHGATAQASLNLEQGPLLRALYFDLGPTRPGRLLLICHHLVIDGVSWRVLIEDLQTRYSAPTAALPPKTSSFKAWAERLLDYAQGDALRVERDYWLQQPWALATPLPVQPAQGPSRPVTMRGALPSAATRALLRESPWAYSTRVDELLLAALVRTLGEWAGGPAVLVDLEGHGREELFDDLDVTRTVGWFTSLYPVVLAAPSAATPGELIVLVKEQLRRVPRRGIGYGLLRYLNDAAAVLAAPAQAQVRFNYLGQVDQMLPEGSPFGLADEATGAEISPAMPRPYLLDLNAVVVGGELKVIWSFDAGTLSEGLVARLAGRFLAVLQNLLDHCLSADAGAISPADFPLLRLRQDELARLASAVGSRPGRPARAQIENIYPLTPLQQGMLFHSLFAPDSGVYCEQLVATLRGPFDPAAFVRAWQIVADRHPILRTAFVWEGVETPAQVVLHQAAMPYEQQDWRGLAEEERAARLVAYLERDRARGFALTQAPLMRLALLQVEDDAYQMLWSHHHLLLDGWSVSMLYGEVFAAYEAGRLGQLVIAEPRRPYHEYLAWLQRQPAAPAERYWREQLRGFRAPTALPGARPPGGPPQRGALCELQLPAVAGAALARFAREQQLTLNTIVQGAWALLLSRYAGEPDVVFGITVAGRPTTLPGVEQMLGLFINTVPLRVRLQLADRLGDWLRGLQTQQAEARQHEHTSLAQIQGWSELPPGQALFESLLVFENYPIDAALRGESARVSVEAVQVIEETNYPLTLAVIPGEPFTLRAMYDPGRLAAASVERVLGHLRTLLAGMLQGADQPLRGLALASPVERASLLERGRAARRAPTPVACLHHRFEGQVERTPAAVALSDEHEQLSYAELNERANRLAHTLLRYGLGRERLVGLYLDRTAELVIAVLAILKAGAAYLPIDPAYPPERVGFMLADAQVGALITQESLLAALGPLAAPAICVDRDAADIADGYPTNPAVESRPDDLAYVIYTSGSTGAPKGTLISHVHVARLFSATEHWFGFDQRDVWSLFHSIAFDFSVWELWGALLYGGRLVVVPFWVSRDPAAFYALLTRERVTVLNQTPSAFRQLIPIDQAAAPGQLALRYVIFGGEALVFESLRPWFARHGDTRPRLVNMYGITETTVHVTYRPLAATDLDQGLGSAIGVPIPDLELYVLDEALRPTPVGVPGELFVGGAGVARGYLGRPALTAARFIPHPFSSTPGARLYRTGDLARHLPDGDLEYLGRIDHQVKIRGFRIELGEIEAALRRCPQVRDAAVLARDDAPGGRRLVAYLVTHAAAEPGNALAAELRRQIQASLPDYMVPAVFVWLETLPLTTNGKLDRNALQLPQEQRDAAAFVGPRSPAEAQLAEVWCELLGLERVSVHDNFFALGGDSIISIQAVSRAGARGLRLSPRQIFQHPTIAELAPLVAMAPAVVAEQGAVSGAVPLTPIQRWLLDQAQPEPQHYNQALLLSAPPHLDGARLAAALGALESHHDALRLRFAHGPGGWEQWIADSTDVSGRLTRVDISATVDAELAATIERTAAEAQASLDLGRGPLLRAVWFDCGPARPGRLLLVIHHLAVDGVSWRILLDDLRAVYAQGAGVLPPKTSSYKAWAERLSAAAIGADLAAELLFWLEALPAPGAALPVDLPDAPDADLAANLATQSVALSAEETRALILDAGHAHNTQVGDLLLTALAMTLGEWSGQAQVVVELEGHGREDRFDAVDLSRTVGWFTSLYPARLEPGAADQPGAALVAVKEQLRRIPGGGIGYGLLRYLGDAQTRARLAARGPAAVLFNYLGQLDAGAGDELFSLADEPGGPMISPRNRLSHQLMINAEVVGGELALHWSYSARRYHAETVARLAGRYLAHLRALLAHCLTPTAGGWTPSDFTLIKLEQAQIERVARAVGVPDARAARDQIVEVYPLAPLQQGMLFHSLQTPGEGLYLTQIACTLEGDMDEAAFAAAWRGVIAQTPILRSAFLWAELDEPAQVVLRDAPLPIERLDWRGRTDAEQAEQDEALLAADARRELAFASPPLMRLALARLDARRYRLFWSHHHLLLDGWSVALILEAVFGAYAALREGRAPAWEPRRPYRDYIAWLQGQDLAAAETYWRRALDGFSAPTPLPAARVAADEAAVTHFGAAALSLSEALTTALRTFAQGHQLTLNTLLQGAWALLLSRYSREAEVLFGATVSGRPPELPGVETMAGLFINTLPVRVRVDPDADLVPWLGEIQARQAELRQFEYSPLSQVQKWSGIARGMPLFESIFVFENYPLDQALQHQEGLNIVDVRTGERGNVPLTLLAVPGSQLRLQANYDPRRLDPEGVERLLGQLQTLLAQMAEQPGKLSNLVLSTAAERAQLLATWNATATVFPDATLTLYARFAAQVARTPAAPALVCAGQTLSYAQLFARANQLGHALRARGLGPDQLVAVVMERSLDLVVALYGVLAAGAAYLPIDPAAPPARVAHMLADSQAPVLLTQAHLRHLLPPRPASVLCLDADWDTLTADLPPTPPPARTRPEHLAYVIYTSGSTGTPKGAMNAHRAIGNRLDWMQQAYPLDATDRVLQKTPFSFDVSVWEFFWPLQVGATLVVAPPGAHQDSAALAALVAAERISTIHFVPSMLQAFVEEPGLAACRSLRRVICSGEALPYALQQRFFARCAAELHNLYGPTEAAVDVSAWACQRASRTPVVPIGRPIANLQLYVLDARMQPVGIGVPGELYLGGLGLGRGYWRRPDLTAERFGPDPYGAAGGRLYRTGDLARWRGDGVVEYLGRLDFQVKLHGLRIELGEIEAGLTRHPAVRESVVLLREDKPGQPRLVAYVVPQTAAEGGPQLGAALRAHLRGLVPEYMLPAAFVALERLPLSPNGKLERRALPAPQQEPGAGEAYLPPRTPVEERLAGIWQHVLGVAQVGVNDNFFALGGDSILSLQIIARAHQAGLGLSPQQIFQAPTVAQLALLVEAAPAIQAEQGPVTGPSPLTPIQRWFFARELAKPQHFNQALLLTVPADLDPAHLQAALGALLAHHDALRSRFVRGDDGAWAQELAAPDQGTTDARPALLLLHPLADMEAYAAALQASLDLAHGPLLRAALYRGEPDAPGRLLLVAHHLVIDGVSWRVLLEDLQLAYTQAAQGQPVRLLPKTSSYRLWAERLAAYAQSANLLHELAFWQQLAAAPAIALPADSDVDRRQLTMASARSVQAGLSREETRALLHEAHAAYNTQINDLLLAALARTLASWAGAPRVLIELEGHGREPLFDGLDLSRTVGWFTTRYPLALEVTATESGALIRAVKEQIRRVPGRGIGYGLLRFLRHGPEAAALAAAPAPELEFNYLGQLDQALEAEDGLFSVAEEPIGPDVAPEQVMAHPLIVNAQVLHGELCATWIYNERLHRRETIARLAHTYVTALRDLIAHCLTPGVGGLTPSDVPLIQLDDAMLDDLMGSVEFEG